MDYKEGESLMLSDKTSEAIDILVGKCFDLNRTFDRAVSILTNVFSMPQAADIVHHKLAHLWPVIADEYSSFKDEWNITTYYPETHGDGRTYSNLQDMMETLLKETLEMYEMQKMAYSVAKENGDLNACAFFMRMVRILTIVVGQVYTLRDKAEQMPNDYDSYDAHIDDWGIDGVDLTNPHTGSDD